MFKKSFKGKIILPVSIIIVALVVILTTFLSIRYRSFSNSLINDELTANISSLNLDSDSEVATLKKQLDSEVAIYLKRASGILIRDGIIIGTIGLAISIVLLFFIVSSVSKPLVSLSNDMNKFANGNLDVSINISSEDEIGQLGRSLQKSINIIKKLIVDIKTMVAEQEMGNSNYRLNVDGFDGDYKLLVKDISELANFGVRDQLTGIPNRRSFDCLLAMEWNQAKRDKKPVSIMVLDLDNFKTYNDKFGHQQGDLALISVATVLMQSLKRPPDFVARWGGEEFVILLPNTDSGGAFAVAERIRMNIENLVIPCNDERAAKTTISIGIHTQVPDQVSRLDAFISKADMALYKAKEAGRNKVLCYGNT